MSNCDVNMNEVFIWKNEANETYLDVSKNRLLPVLELLLCRSLRRLLEGHLIAVF